MPSLHDIPNYVNGQKVAPKSGAYLENIDPAIGKAYSRVPASGPLDVNAAVAAAKDAFPAWSATPAAERSRILLKIADLIEQNLERLAHAESVDTGKPISLARSIDIPRSAA